MLSIVGAVIGIGLAKIGMTVLLAHVPPGLVLVTEGVDRRPHARRDDARRARRRSGLRLVAGDAGRGTRSRGRAAQRRSRLAGQGDHEPRQARHRRRRAGARRDAAQRRRTPAAQLQPSAVGRSGVPHRERADDEDGVAAIQVRLDRRSHLRPTAARARGGGAGRGQRRDDELRSARRRRRTASRSTCAGAPTPRPSDEPDAEVRQVTPAFFNTLGVPILRGRGIQDGDAPGAPSVYLVNQAFVKRFFPNENPLGQFIRLGWGRGPDEPYCEIVGVVGDVHGEGLEDAPLPTVYASLAQHPFSSLDASRAHERVAGVARRAASRDRARSRPRSAGVLGADDGRARGIVGRPRSGSTRRSSRCSRPSRWCSPRSDSTE